METECAGYDHAEYSRRRGSSCECCASLQFDIPDKASIYELSCLGSRDFVVACNAQVT